ncbi:hypothetical protein [Streptomyces cyaneogriseus]|uniref:hypothetical protein n=1 Tax=Streptomyces cyaneogriseus TaxID=68192 RepID=UPI000AC40BEB|nr:hypothetical protein [Streptomyces cyaneogriseus]
MVAGEFVQVPGGVGFGAQDGGEAVGGEGRITSYNVCYTKLLRVVGLPRRADDVV